MKWDKIKNKQKGRQKQPYTIINLEIYRRMPQGYIVGVIQKGK